MDTEGLWPAGSRSPKKKMPKKKAICDLCCESLEKGQDILQCEGDCGCLVHRYCAGVTKRHFDELSKGSKSKPFVNGARWPPLTVLYNSCRPTKQL